MMTVKQFKLDAENQSMSTILIAPSVRLGLSGTHKLNVGRVGTANKQFKLDSENQNDVTKTCRLCHEIISSISDTPLIEHAECIKQWEERSRNMKCFRCGKARAPNSSRCADCTLNSPYRNYEGPKDG